MEVYYRGAANRFCRAEGANPKNRSTHSARRQSHGGEES